MKPFKYICCILTALCLFFILLINAIDYSVYYRPQFYKKTYAKYNVTDAAQMEMSEILKLSDYLTDYLKGKNDSLKDYRAVVAGQQRLFYSERELLHMQDVKDLFLGAITIRRICIITVILLIIIMLLTKMNFIRTLARCIIGTFLGILGILGFLACIIASDFNRAFTMFHHIFFSNDLWLLDPDEDWVIRLLPEGFFMDMATVIGIVFSISLIVVLCVCAGGLYQNGKKRNQPHNRTALTLFV